MAKLVIKKEDLPPVNGDSESFAIRYRLVSEDRSKFSYWSPIFNVPVARQYTATEAAVSKSGSIVSVVWDFANGIDSYDIWVRWGVGDDNGDWQFVQNTGNNSLNLIIPTGPNRFSVRIYESTHPNTIQHSYFLIYETLNHTV